MITILRHQRHLRTFTPLCRNSFANNKLDKDGDNLVKLDTKSQVTKSKLNGFWKGYQNHIVAVAKDHQETKPKGSEEYRIAILFEGILQKQKTIPLYDTHGRVFLLKFWSTFFFVGLGSWLLHWVYTKGRWRKKPDDKLKLLLGGIFLVFRLRSYRSLQKFHVEKVTYSTETKGLTITQRNIFGWKRNIEIPKDKLLFTSDKYLNSKGINYINIDTMVGYQIGYKYAWVNKELFSHLLQQNITSIRNQQ